jgi:hypothetical protein
MALPQPLHIFRKDLMHLWPEVLFVLALFAGFAALAPSAWTGSEYAPYVALGAFLIKCLMVISWLVLIARSIQDESLVGDRQFWTSRPYHWAKLLAAKAILIFTCIYVPFFIMQCYLLKHSGLHPMLVIPALLHNLLLLTVVVVIPLAALSAVTSTFPRVLLTFVGALLGILILFAIIGWVNFLQMQPPHLEWLFDAIFIGLPAVALFIQYKTRKTLIARLVLGATPVLAALLVLFAPSGAVIGRAYPVLTGASAPSLTGVLDKIPTPPVDPNASLAVFRNHVTLSLPVGVANVDKDVNFLVRGARVTLTGAGVNYTSPFLGNIRPAQIGGERPFALLTFMLPRDIFNKVHTTPVDLHLQLAADQFKAETPSTWHATLLPFSVPGNGLCTFPPDGDAAAEPTCRYPLHQPEISFVSAPLAAASCNQPAAPPVTGEASVGGTTSIIPDFDPVITVPLNFRTGDPNPQHNYVLCPGSALTFVDAVTLPRAGLVVDEKQVVLDPLAERFTTRNRRGAAPPQSGPEPQ